MKWVALNIRAKILIGLTILVLVGIAGFAVWRVRLALDLNRELAAIQAEGLPVNGDQANVYYTAVSSSSNAALRMADAFELLTNLHGQRSNAVLAINFPARKQSLSADQLELVADYCAMNADALAMAESAGKLPASRYPMDLTWDAATMLPHLGPLKRLAVIAEDRCLLDPTNCAEPISVIIGIAHTLDSEPIIISKMLRIALLAMAAQSLEHSLNATPLSDQDLARLEQRFAASEQTNQIANALIGERAMNIRYFRMSLAEIQRLANQSEDNSTANGGPPIPGNQPLFSRITGFFDRDLRFYLGAMKTNIWLQQYTPLNTAQITNVDNQNFSNARQRFYIMSGMVLPPVRICIAKNLRCLAMVRTAELALAVEQFRAKEMHLPENLSKLVPDFIDRVPADPFDGQPLRYKILDKGYVIYSVGLDGQDNGGRERPADAKRSDQTPYDITFTVER